MERLARHSTRGAGGDRRGGAPVQRVSEGLERVLCVAGQHRAAVLRVPQQLQRQRCVSSLLVKRLTLVGRTSEHRGAAHVVGSVERVWKRTLHARASVRRFGRGPEPVHVVVVAARVCVAPRHALRASVRSGIGRRPERVVGRRRRRSPRRHGRLVVVESLVGQLQRLARLDRGVRDQRVIRRLEGVRARRLPRGRGRRDSVNDVAGRLERVQRISVNSRDSVKPIQVGFVYRSVYVLVVMGTDVVSGLVEHVFGFWHGRGCHVHIGGHVACRVGQHEALLGLFLLAPVLGVHEDHHAQEDEAKRAGRDDEKFAHLVNGWEGHTCKITNIYRNGV